MWAKDAPITSAITTERKKSSFSIVIPMANMGMKHRISRAIELSSKDTTSIRTIKNKKLIYSMYKSFINKNGYSS